MQPQDVRGGPEDTHVVAHIIKPKVAIFNFGRLVANPTGNPFGYFRKVLNRPPSTPEGSCSLEVSTIPSRLCRLPAHRINFTELFTCYSISEARFQI